MPLLTFRRAQVRYINPLSCLCPVSAKQTSFSHRRHVSFSLFQRKSSGAPKPSQQTTVNHYEQEYDSVKKRVQFEKVTDSVEHLEEVKQAILDLRKIRKEASEAPELFGLTGEDREKTISLLKDAEDRAASKAAERRKANPHLTASDNIAKLNVPVLRRQKPYIDNINKYLKEAQGPKPTAATVKELWRWYSRAKANLPPFLYLVPPAVWHVLWTVLSQASVTNTDRWARLKVLFEDMVAAGHELSSAQKIAYIEALHHEGYEKRAVEVWGEEIVAVGMDDKAFEQFWTLGVQIFAAQGDPDRAQKTAYMLLNSKGGKDVRILLPVIRAWTTTGGSRGFRNAWNLYIYVRERLGENTKIEDFDDVSMSFLRAGKKDLALAVFKDMMLSKSPGSTDSLVLYKKAMGFVGDLQSITSDSQEANQLSLETMSVLPRKYQNKFFFGSWIKRLIGMGEIDAAIAVTDLMCDRGVQPAPKYLNGIAGALFRENTESSRANAERLTWSMIKERQELVRQRQSQEPLHYLGTTISLPSSNQQQGERKLKSPPATVETFCILIDQYIRLDKHQEIQKLRQILLDCELTPNADFLNQYLYSILRSDGLGKAWDEYKAMIDPRGTWRAVANLATFQCLWDFMAMKKGRVTIASTDGDFPSSSRHLFAEMVHWWKSVGQRQRSQQMQHFSHKLFNDIVRCFGLGDNPDHSGMLVALYGILDMFGGLPNDHTARLILVSIVPPSPDEGGLQKPTRNRRLNKKPTRQNLKAAIGEATRLLSDIQEARMQHLRSLGKDPEQLNPEDLGKEKLFILGEVLRVTISSTLPGDVSIEDELQAASQDMDVPFLEIFREPDVSGY